MKTSNKKKIVVSTLALAMGAALAGSISGSVAWYQYSTRVSASIVGVSAGTSRNLQISDDSGTSWKQNISFASVNFRPIAAVAANPAAATTTISSWYEHPVYKTAAQTAMANNEATINEVATVAYAEHSFVFKCEDKTNSTTPAQVAKPVYLSAFEIVYTGDADISPAIRISIDGDHDFLMSEEAGTTNTHGTLDLNLNGVLDKDGVLVDDVSGSEITYYAGSADSSYKTVAPSSVLATVTDPYNFTDTENRDLTTTKTSGNSNAVTVKIWIEGWQQLATAYVPENGTELDGAGYYTTRDLETPATGTANGTTTYYKASSVWDDGYFAQNFTVNMQFACEADE